MHEPVHLSANECLNSRNNSGLGVLTYLNTKAGVVPKSGGQSAEVKDSLNPFFYSCQFILIALELLKKASSNLFLM